MSRRVTLHYAPHSRASCTLALLEVLRADYDLHVLDLHRGEQREAAHLAVNPLGKVPAIRHGDAVVTEQGAIFLHLADLYADRGLAPALDDPLRGPYLRWRCSTPRASSRRWSTARCSASPRRPWPRPTATTTA